MKKIKQEQIFQKTVCNYEITEQVFFFFFREVNSLNFLGANSWNPNILISY